MADKKATSKKTIAKTKNKIKPAPAQKKIAAITQKTKKLAGRQNKAPIAKAYPAEKAFDEIADDWDSKRQTPSSVMPLFLETLKRFLRGNYFGVRVLDLGCGNARNAAHIVKTLRFPTVACADVSQQMLIQAQKTAISNNLTHSIQILRTNASQLSFPTQSFTAAFAIAVLHHLPTITERENAFHELYRVLRVPGIAFITVWNSDQPKLSKYNGKKDALVAWATERGKKAERYYHFFTEQELEKYAVHAGFKVHEAFFEKNGKKTSARKGAANICLVLLKAP